MQKKQTSTKKISLNKEKIMPLSATEMAKVFGKGAANKSVQTPTDLNPQWMPTDLSGGGTHEPPH